eukprot:913523-Pyramimonas_sp.AAC.1
MRLQTVTQEGRCGFGFGCVYAGTAGPVRTVGTTPKETLLRQCKKCDVAVEPYQKVKRKEKDPPPPGANGHHDSDRCVRSHKQRINSIQTSDCGKKVVRKTINTLSQFVSFWERCTTADYCIVVNIAKCFFVTGVACARDWDTPALGDDQT